MNSTPPPLPDAGSGRDDGDARPGARTAPPGRARPARRWAEGGIVSTMGGLLARRLRAGAFAADGALRASPPAASTASPRRTNSSPRPRRRQHRRAVPARPASSGLIGDPRAHFDPAAWMPMLAVLTPSCDRAAQRRRRPRADAAPARRAAAAPPRRTSRRCSRSTCRPRPATDLDPGRGSPRGPRRTTCGRAAAAPAAYVEQIAALPADIAALCALSGVPTPARRAEPPDFVELHQELHYQPRARSTTLCVPSGRRASRSA